ncbi:PREDICTED: ataxin-7-like protein 3 [Colobus angolensis palliatus]|uniref:ataxin-7-like protein 3 n=1 Tax=Colobus angolensis palliatus TaxID=336983 RepID=UPI0005F3FA7C|nr:PREDICTED: ataxin-7-like protein 3 [Colobus angolensis palliatus]
MKMEEMSLSGLDNSKLEAIAQEIYADLVEDSCLGFCFEVHRAVKCGYFFLDDTDPDSMKDFEIVDQPGLDIFGQVFNQWKSKECVCPNCSRSIAASRFAPHLEKCLGMGRNSSRIANRRIANSNNMNKSESDQEDNDDINDNDWSYGSEKKAKKRKSDKHIPIILRSHSKSPMPQQYCAAGERPEELILGGCRLPQQRCKAGGELKPIKAHEEQV